MEIKFDEETKQLVYKVLCAVELDYGIIHETMDRDKVRDLLEDLKSLHAKLYAEWRRSQA